MRTTTHRTSDRGQLAFEWTSAAIQAAVSRPAPAHLPEVNLAPRLPLNPQLLKPDHDSETRKIAEDIDRRLVRVLPWDFRTCFPEPLAHASIPALAEAGNKQHPLLKHFHEEKARQGLALLADADRFGESERLDIDPQIGCRPSNAAGLTALSQRLNHEKSHLERAFDSLIAGYGETFGKQAAEAFHTALRVWHLGGAVITTLPPSGPALADAVERAHFGYEEDGVAVEPSEEEAFEITLQLGEYLRDLDAPDLRERLLHQYAGDFGQEAAESLDRWSLLINQAEEDETASLQYDPGHPWHYYREGDAAEPMPIDEIPAAPSWDLPVTPKIPRKRAAFLQQLLVDQERQLSEDRNRYTELAEKGADALSAYDRNIAHNGNDDLAWASAVALKFNHIRNGQARVAALRAALVKAPGG